MDGLQALAQSILLVVPGFVFVLMIAYAVSCWNRLPDRVASHFDGAGNANGWMTKGALAAIFLTVEFGVGAAIYVIESLRLPEATTAIMALYFVVVFLGYMFWLCLRVNLLQTRMSAPQALAGAVCGLACAALAAWSKL